LFGHNGPCDLTVRVDVEANFIHCQISHTVLTEIHRPSLYLTFTGDRITILKF